MDPTRLDHLLPLLTLEIAVIVGASRLLGVAFRRVGQPQVIGEIVAGLLLGPSGFGWLAPQWSAALFPAEALPFLRVLSEYGIVFFMFLVGLELDPALLRERGRAAVIISVASVGLPFALGAAVALPTYGQLAAPHATPITFALFLGAAMAITAFPVLARILIERNLLRSRVGALALTCAAANDVAGWCIVAGVVAVAPTAAPVEGLRTVAGLLAFVALMVLGVRPLVGRIQALYESRGGLTQNVLAVMLLLVLLSTLATQAVGAHAIFGAFLLGAIMPHHAPFVRDLADKIEDFAVVFFLPIYFAYTGLRTEIGRLDTPELAAYAVLFTTLAIAGKWGGTALAARALRFSWREAGALGALMNTRGLMELVLLNIGLDLGLISPALFAIMVVMAVVTTVMTAPALAAIYPTAQLRADALRAEEPAAPRSTVLLPIALASSGPRLLDVALALAEGEHPRCYALHIERPAERGTLGAHVADRKAQLDTLVPVLQHAQARGVEVRPLVLTSRSPGDDICDVARAKGAAVIVMGWHKPVFGRSVLGGTVERVMRMSAVDVAVLIDKGLPDRVQRVLLPYTGTVHDRFALFLAARVAQRFASALTLLHVVRPGREAPRLEAEARSLLEATVPEPTTGGTTHLQVVESGDPVTTVIEHARGYDLAILGIGEEWRVAPTVFGLRAERIATECPSSLLIVRSGLERLARP
jgi:Kef-type K+ transport system membrane component KefB/nucleotide-binding universal stress UspA family protein